MKSCKFPMSEQILLPGFHELRSTSVLDKIAKNLHLYISPTEMKWGRPGEFHNPLGTLLLNINESIQCFKKKMWMFLICFNIFCHFLPVFCSLQKQKPTWKRGCFGWPKTDILPTFPPRPHHCSAPGKKNENAFHLLLGGSQPIFFWRKNSVFVSP